MSRTKHHGIKAKKRTYGDARRWLPATPSWWTRLMMNKPQRRLASIWQRNTEKTAIKDLPDVDKPPHGKKPHIYYW